MNNNNIISDSFADFLNVSEAEFTAEKARYGNCFMNLRKKLINKTLGHMELESKFLDKFYFRKAGMPEKKTDTLAPEPAFNKDLVHERYGHFLDKYL